MDKNKTYSDFIKNGGEFNWQKYWEEHPELSEAEDDSKKGFFSFGNKEKKKQYNLVEFPYPSGAGLHVGHVRSYTALDVVSRKMRMEGKNVLYPIGWDAFGLPTENYAIKNKIHPRKATEENVATFKRQLKSLGLSFDWSREINTTDPEYYKWTQWIFLKLFEKGLAYKKKMAINWCPSCKIGLANEEVVDGKCERCGAGVEQKEKEQWMLKITEYAERLIDDLETVDYSERIKMQQINWIGKSEGAEIEFKIKELDSCFRGNDKGNEKKKIKVFTTRPDTLFGCTYIVLSPEHWFVNEQITNNKLQITNKSDVEDYVRKAKQKTELQRTILEKEKVGVKLEGVMAINPANQEEVPVFVADYVLASYGTGAIMAVPSHDERDFEFAISYNLPILSVIKKPETELLYFNVSIHDEDVSKTAEFVRVNSKKSNPISPVVRNYELENKFIEEIIKVLKEDNLLDGGLEKMIRRGGDFILYKDENGEVFDSVDIYTGDGEHINSDFINGLNNKEAINSVIKWLEDKNVGKRNVVYKLRDWVFSRQHYWGEPIPMVDCEKCGWVPVLEKDLPVELPEVEHYEPTDTGESPLAVMEDWVNVKCPKCGGEAKRETDTMPNWAGSSWYFLRYIDSKKSKELADKNKLKKWMPVDLYNGGMEHTTLHLLYSRFWNKFLFDIGVVPVSEPYQRRRSHGIVLAEDGRKMSKSFGNVINPDEIVERFGADSLRLYEMFMGPFSDMIPWSTDGLVGTKKFLERVFLLKLKINKVESKKDELEKITHQTIKKVGEDIEGMKFNTAVSQMMIWVNEAVKVENIERGMFEIFLRVLAPFAPHIAEELWSELGNKESIFKEEWPKFDENLIKDEIITLAVQVNGKVRGEFEVQADISEEEAKKKALEVENVKKFLEGRKPKKIIFVKGKLVSIVV